MALNVTTAVFGEGCNTATASPSLAQWDTEQVLQISGIDLPDSYKVEFSTVYTRNAIPEVGDASGVAIPNVLLQRSAPITAYVVLYGENGGRNREYWITIHITPGQPPETITPDPEQADVIDQAIAALNNGVARTEAAATSAEGSASDAADHAKDAEAWAVGQRDGVDVPDTDPTYRNNAKYYAGAAEAAAEEAGRHEASWESWVRRAETAADDAEGSARAAAGSKADAETAAQTATRKATEAGNSATAAAGSAASARQTVDGGVGAINTARDGALTQIGSAGSNATAAVNQAGTTQTERVTTEGNTQVNRVQAKGDEVIRSIPQDYTDLVDDVADLSRQLSDKDLDAVPLIKKNLLLVKSENVFDKTDITAGHLDLAGEVVVDSYSMVSGYIPVNVGDAVKTYYISGLSIYAANMGAVCGYSADKTFVSGTRSTYVNTYTIPNEVAFIRFHISIDMVDTYMLIVNGTQPTTYIPYQNFYIATPAFIDSAVSTYDFANRPISKAETDFWEEEKSANLYNVDDVVLYEYFNSNGTTQQNQNVARAYVLLDGAGTYSFKVDGVFFGLANALKIPCFDKNKNYIKFITATTEEATATKENLCALTITNSDILDGVAFIGFTMASSLYETAMVVKGENYPTSYIPYHQYWTIPDLVSVSKNQLFGKEIVFDGDSICAGLGSAMGNYGNGWAGRIGIDYGANAINVGVSGACITAETYFDGDTSKPRHWISRYIDTIYANYPDADYIIAEGGTNDADNFYNDTSRLGTFSETDFTGPFDDTTFYGAMDSWCKKALTYYPKAKVGFIVAHKMGTGFITYVKNRFDYFGYASKVCKKWGIPVLNLWDDGQLRPDVTSMYDPQYNTIESATEHGLPYYDGQHLTAYGYDVISPKIAEWMKTL